MQFLELTVGLGLALLLYVFLSFCSWLFAFVALDLVSSVLSQEIGWEEHLQNYFFCAE